MLCTTEHYTVDLAFKDGYGTGCANVEEALRRHLGNVEGVVVTSAQPTQERSNVYWMDPNTIADYGKVFDGKLVLKEPIRVRIEPLSVNNTFSAIPVDAPPGTKSMWLDNSVDHHPDVFFKTKEIAKLALLIKLRMVMQSATSVNAEAEALISAAETASYKAIQLLRSTAMPKKKLSKTRTRS